jgi:serine/threonine protein kinase
LAAWKQETNGSETPYASPYTYKKHNSLGNLLRADELVVRKGLGQGGFGVVVEVEAKSTRQSFAMKCISKNRFTESSYQNIISREIKILSETEPSPFLLRCHLAFETQSQVFLVTDLLSGGDIFFHLDKLESQGQHGFSENQARIILAEVSMGVVHLHRRGFIHLDLKIENVMFDKNGHIKIVDFGLSVELSLERDDERGCQVEYIGSLMSAAPELLQEKIAGRFSDWWSLGVMAHDIMTGQTPWSSMTDRDRIRHDIFNQEVLPPQELSFPAGEFVAALLHKDRRMRLGTRSDNEVIESPFFDCVDWKAVEQGQALPAFVPNQGTWSISPHDSSRSLALYRHRVIDADRLSACREGAMGLTRASRAPPIRMARYEKKMRIS